MCPWTTIKAGWTRAVLTVALLGCCGAQAQESVDPAALMRRMVTAAQELNYDGSFVYRSGPVVESMRIIHRRDENGERERLLSLGGVAREVLRDNDRVTCILPDDGSVVVGKRRMRGVNRGPLFTSGQLPAHYELSAAGLGRVAGRVAERLVVAPRDAFRFGYRLWVDRETGLLLRTALVAPDGEILEDIAYTNITVPEVIPEELLRPTVSGVGFKWMESAARSDVSAESRQSAWTVTWLPRGFRISEHVVDSLPGMSHPVEHMVFSDGLASLSVFVEALSNAGEPQQGHSRMGPVSAYGRLIDSFQVTVVGEVPSVTVQRVGDAVQRR